MEEKGPAKVDFDSLDESDETLDLRPSVRSAPPGGLSFYGIVRNSEGVALTNSPLELLANSASIHFDEVDKKLKGKGRLVVIPQVINSQFPLSTTDRRILLGERVAKAALKQGNSRYLRNLQYLQVVRSVYDGLLLTYQLLLVRRRRTKSGSPYFSARLRRDLIRWKRRIIADPYAAAAELKRIGGLAREAWFENRRIFDVSLLREVHVSEYVQFSYIGRAMPAPDKRGAGKELDAYVKRVTSTPPPVVQDWATFIKNYLDEFSPARPAELRTDPSVSASLGYPRVCGGFTKAVQDLVSLGFAIFFLSREEDEQAQKLVRDYASDVDLKQINKWTRKPHPGFRMRHSTSDDGPPEDWGRMDSFHFKRDGIYQTALGLAVRVVLGRAQYLPLSPIPAGEKGLKMRIPATTMAAATLVYQLLRRSLDSYLFQDERFSEFMGGKLSYRDRIGHNVSGSYSYSQDLSFATDLHPFWLERSVYEQVVDREPRLEWTRQFFDKLFGPHSVIRDPDSIPAPPDDPLMISHPRWSPSLAGLDTSSKPELPMLTADRHIPLSEECKTLSARYMRDYLYWVDEVSRPRILTSTSASMGDSTSFPVMPLVTAYAGWKAGAENLRGAGDDAVVRRMTAAKEAVFNSALESCGAVLSKGDKAKGKPNKIFRHKNREAFCEEMFERKSGVWRRIRYYHTSLWSAPPGGSKGSVDWYSQPSAISEHDRRLGKRTYQEMWRKSPHFPKQALAQRMGLPVGLPVELGGINHPKFGKGPRNFRSKTDERKWGNRVSRISVVGWATGTGLSPLPSGLTDLNRKLSTRFLESLTFPGKEVIRTYPTNPDGTFNVPLESVGDLVANSASSWELYHRVAARQIKTPSIEKLAAKFRGKIRTIGPDVYRGFDATLLDVQVKKNHFVSSDASDVVTLNSGLRRYGLAPALLTFDQKNLRRWEHLSRSRVDRAYMVPKI